ncbi:MAG: sugar ABC transporter permease [Anaerolineae bacterium]|nr:sugar ABC transporter permease [Anaerolineae bacterium]
MSTVQNPPALAETTTEQPKWMRWRGYLLRPAVIYLVLLTQVPLLLTLYYSLSNWNFLRPDRTRFVGLDNYLDFFRNPDIITIIRNTLVFSTSVVLWSLVLGMILALLLNRDFLGRGLARTLLITPFLIMPTVSAVMWKNMLFNPAFGLISSTLAALGGPRIDWINSYPMLSIIIIVTWEWTPFMMLILLAGLQSLSQDSMEAAQIDGAGVIEIFYYIILPHLRRYIEIGVLLEVLFVLNIFGEIFVTTTGGPAIETTTLTFDIYKEAFLRWNVGRASAYGVFAVILANIVTLFFLRIIRSNNQQKAVR